MGVGGPGWHACALPSHAHLCVERESLPHNVPIPDRLLKRQLVLHAGAVEAQVLAHGTVQVKRHQPGVGGVDEAVGVRRVAQLGRQPGLVGCAWGGGGGRWGMGDYESNGLCTHARAATCTWVSLRSLPVAGTPDMPRRARAHRQTHSRVHTCGCGVPKNLNAQRLTKGGVGPDSPPVGNRCRSNC